MREKGYVLLFMADAGWVHFFSKTKALLPEDWRKLKIFAERTDEAYTKMMRDVGFQPVPLDFNDLLQGLTTGNMLDALPCAPFYALAGQLYNAAKHMIAINWVPLSGGAVISRKVWDTLPADTQTTLLKIAQLTGEEIQAASRKENEDAIAAMEKRGLIVYRPDAEGQAAWEKFAETLLPRIRGSLVPAAAFDEAIQLVKARRAQTPTAK
jgi:TRAP-type C4-dicarboxylate transport system substrate-binding protein